MASPHYMTCPITYPYWVLRDPETGRFLRNSTYPCKSPKNATKYITQHYSLAEFEWVVVKSKQHERELEDSNQ